MASKHTWPTGEQTIATIRRETDVCLLAFSCGKDSVHGDSVVWVRRNGVIERTTPAEIEASFDDSVAARDGGQVYYQPADLEILTASSNEHRQAVPVFKPVAYLMAHDVAKPLYEFILAGGRTIRTTADHSVMVSGSTDTHGGGLVVEPMPASQVKVGDRMMALNDAEFETPEQTDIPDWLLRLGGLWIADGCYAVGRKIVISAGGNAETVAFLRAIPRTKPMVEKARAVLDSLIADRFQGSQEVMLRKVACQLGTTRATVANAVYRKGGKTHEHIRAKVLPKGDVWLCDKGLVSRMQALGFVGKSHTKRVPRWVFTLSRRQIGIFLAGYLDGDGCSSRGGFVATSVNRILLNDMADLFQRIGVPCAVNTQYGVVGGFRQTEGELSHLSATSDYAHDQLARWCPTWKKLLPRNGSGEKPRYAFSTHVVKEIRRIPSARVYDFEVADCHTFIADGVLVHNSIAAFLALRPHFERIVPVYKYSVPGLEFVEEALAYYAKFFGTPILQVPHPSTFRWLNNLTFQAPENCALIEDVGLPMYNHEHMRDLAASRAGLPAGTWIAVGTRACDSLQRRMSFNRHGPAKASIATFYPVWDWNKARVFAAIKDAGCKLPADYRVFGRSFDGIDFRFLYGIRKHWPRDYARILEWYPLADLELFRYECAMKRKVRA